MIPHTAPSCPSSALDERTQQNAASHQHAQVLCACAESAAQQVPGVVGQGRGAITLGAAQAAGAAIARKCRVRGAGADSRSASSSTDSSDVNHMLDGALGHPGTTRLEAAEEVQIERLPALV